MKSCQVTKLENLEIDQRLQQADYCSARLYQTVITAASENDGSACKKLTPYVSPAFRDCQDGHPIQPCPQQCPQGKLVNCLHPFKAVGVNCLTV